MIKHRIVNKVTASVVIPPGTGQQSPGQLNTAVPSSKLQVQTLSTINTSTIHPSPSQSPLLYLGELIHHPPHFTSLAESPPTMADPQFAKYPDLSLAQDIFNLSNPSCASTVQQTSFKRLQDAISEHKMAPLYRHLAHPTEGILNASGEGVPQQPSTNGAATRPVITSNLLPGRKLSAKINLPWDEKLYDTLKEDNKKELESYQKEEEEAAEAAGDTEVLAAQGKRAEFWARVGDKVRMTEVLLHTC